LIKKLILINSKGTFFAISKYYLCGEIIIYEVNPAEHNYNNKGSKVKMKILNVNNQLSLHARNCIKNLL